MLDTEREYQALLNNAPVGIVYTKDKIITRHNIHFAKIFGFESSVINQPARIVFRSDADYAALGIRAENNASRLGYVLETTE